MLRSHCKHAERAGLVFQTQDAVCYPLHVTGQSHANIPDVFMPQGEHLLHGRDPSAGEAFVVLAHFDGLQPLGHRPEHGAVTAAGAGQADGHAWIKVSDGFQRLWASQQFVQDVDDV